MKDLAEELQEIGLSDKEAKVYLAILELGQETVQTISKKAGVNRATTYVVLESLQNKGLVTTFEQNKKTLFIVEGPHALNNIIREQEDEVEKKDSHLDELMPELGSIYNLHPSKPIVRFYEGKEGLKEMIKERASHYNNSEMSVFYPSKQVREFFGVEQTSKFRENRIKRGIRNRVIYSDSEGFDPQSIMLADLKKIPDELKFSSVIEIWDDKVLIASLEGHISALVIENKLIADTMNSIFNLGYEAAVDEGKT